MDAQLLNIAPLYPDGFFIQWTLTNANESGAYVFDLYRSGGREGPWDVIATNLQNQYAFIDRFEVPEALTTEDVLRPNQLNQFREYAYKLVATSPSGAKAQVIDTNGPNFEGALNDRKMNQYWRKSVRDFRLTLKFNGTRCIVLKRKHWGTRCDCVDKKTREIVRSSCKRCWGTGLVDGYWTPFATYARRNVSSNASAITPEAKSDSNDVKFWMPDYPSLEADDIIVFLKDNTRWRVDQGTQTQIRLQDVHQVVSAQALDHGHIIYRLPVDTSQIHPLF
jgi:hypothetical protein